ncbi:MAG: PCRF domain-containing protein, partial [Bryobacteraceae bacterium]
MQYARKLDEIEARFEELTRQMADPALIQDPERYRKTAKAHAELDPIVARYREWKKLDSELAQARQLLEESDDELRKLAEEEIERLERERARVEQDLKVLLLPKDPNDDKNVLLEIRAGTGGDEATLFAAEIFRMYARYAESQGWRVEISSVSESEVGGYKEIIALVSGDKVYS